MFLLRSCLLTCLWLGCALASFGAANRPNIVILLADDLGYGETGMQGNPEIPTPNIDSIARNGIRFRQGYVTAPLCSPSRAGLMTGRYQQRYGHELNPIGEKNLDPENALDAKEKTFADHLHGAGYATGIFGKWHLGGTPDTGPLHRGFDEFHGFLHEGHFYAPPPYAGVYSRFRTNEPPYDANNSIYHNSEPVTEKDYLTDALTREAVGFIERHRREPFFLYVPFNAIHSPMQAPLALVERFGGLTNAHRAVFAGMLTSMDNGIGKILARLREFSLEENTLVFFLSDNGGPTAELTSRNLPLSGGKGMMLEGGLRIPFAVQWKSHLPAGKVYESPVSSLDILPTALAAAGVRPPGNLDGIDLTPYLNGAKTGAPHERLFWRMGPQAALREGDWKIVRSRNANRPGRAWQLFNLATDEVEQKDEAAAHPEIVQRLEAAWKTYDAQMVPAR